MSRVLPCRLRRSEEAAKSSVWHISELGWQAHRSRTSGAHIVRTMRTPPCTVRAHSGLTARHVIHRRAAAGLLTKCLLPAITQATLASL
eukprot:scaffold58080_cov58-Phaeocystis_antarctica.AAC.2